MSDTPEANLACRCRSGCGNRRCLCYRAGQACGDACRCVGCSNPFKHLKGSELGACAREHVQWILQLTENVKREVLELPCGCGEALLGDLIEEYTCPECEESYWYSFCWDEVAQSGNTWHCEVCRTCRDWREWHCPRCNRCTYGQSLPCETCGARSELAEFLGDLL